MAKTMATLSRLRFIVAPVIVRPTALLPGRPGADVLFPSVGGLGLGCDSHRRETVIIGSCVFALLAAVASRAAYVAVIARRNLCSPISCALCPQIYLNHVGRPHTLYGEGACGGAGGSRTLVRTTILTSELQPSRCARELALCAPVGGTPARRPPYALGRGRISMATAYAGQSILS